MSIVAVIVAQWTERLLPSLENPGSNPVIGNFEHLLVIKALNCYLFMQCHVGVQDCSFAGFFNGPIPASFLFIFVLFSLQFQYKLKKA